MAKREQRISSVYVRLYRNFFEAKFIIELELFVVNILRVGFSQAPGT